MSISDFRLPKLIIVPSVTALLLSLLACGTDSEIGFDPAQVLTADALLLPLNDGNEPVLNTRVDYAECDQQLPCEWSSADTGVVVTVETVDTDAVTDRLRIVYTIQTTRDTKIKLLGTTTAVDSQGRRYSARAPDVGNAIDAENGTGTLDLLAGITLTVDQPFRESTALGTRFIARFVLGFIEVGQSHEVGFLQLPLNTDTGQAIDCLNRLPCTWLADNDEFSVTVVLADGLLSGRLVVHFQVDAYADVLVKVDSGSIAIGNEGTAFKPKIHTLDEQSDYLAFETPIFADASVTGTQSYFRSASKSATKLKKLTLDITQIGAPGTGFPVFANVPLN